jgi:hypothetical protein
MGYAHSHASLTHIWGGAVFASQSPYMQPQNVIYSRNVRRNGWLKFLDKEIDIDINQILKYIK